MKIEQVNFRKRISDEKILLLAMVGVLEALKRRKISVDEANDFLFSSYMEYNIEESHCSKEVFQLVQQGGLLVDIDLVSPEELPEAVDILYEKALKLLGEMKTEKTRLRIK